MTDSARARDVVLSGVAALLGLASLGVALGRTEVDRPATSPVVASVSRAAGTLQLRVAQALGWRTLRRGDEVHDADSVFVPPGAEAQLLFADGTVLELDERSLVVVEAPRAGVREVTLKQGAMSGRVGTTGLTLTTPAGETRLTPASEARVELNPDGVLMSVTKGSAKLRGDGGEASVGTGQRALVSAAGVEALPAFAVELLAPPPQHRRLFHGVPPPVELTWQGGVPAGGRLQVARDRLFAFVSVDEAAAGGAAKVNPTPGVTWWRVVDARGRALSEARRFTLLEDVPPRPLVPRDGEVVMAPPGTLVGFSWTPLPGINTYRVEISSSRGFEPVALSTEVEGSQSRLKVTLDEGVWFWRVQAADPDLGEVGQSSPGRFRVIHKAIPDAPELLNPEIEVTP